MAKSQTANYDKLRRELDSVLTQLQGEELDIDKAIKAYSRGLELVKELEKYLESAENTTRELKSRPSKNP